MKKRVKRHAVIQPLDQSYRLIALTQNQNAIVDSGDYEWLNQWNWVAWWNPKTDSFYATRRATGERKIILMHRLILGITTGEGDHKNMDTLDNRRSNLRHATRQQNVVNAEAPCTNKSGFKGVSWNKARRLWIAQVSFNNRSVYIGGYKTAKEAAIAYNERAKELHGDFVRLNDVLH